MKRIEAIVQSEMSKKVVNAVAKIGVGGVTLTQSLGQGAGERPELGSGEYFPHQGACSGGARQGVGAESAALAQRQRLRRGESRRRPQSRAQSAEQQRRAQTMRTQ